MRMKCLQAKMPCSKAGIANASWSGLITREPNNVGMNRHALHCTAQTNLNVMISLPYLKPLLTRKYPSGFDQSFRLIPHCINQRGVPSWHCQLCSYESENRISPHCLERAPNACSNLLPFAASFP